jgi:hypothetical protein
MCDEKANFCCLLSKKRLAGGNARVSSSYGAKRKGYNFCDEGEEPEGTAMYCAMRGFPLHGLPRYEREVVGLFQW